MRSPFLVGVTPDFYTDAKGRFESALASKLGAVPYIEIEAMPSQPGNVAQAETINRYDAIFALATRFTAESLRGVERLAVIARWGVGYDMIDTAALTQAGAALAITPGAVRRPVAEAILTYICALTTNLLIQDRVVRKGQWRGALPALGRNFVGRTLGSLGCGNIAQEMFRMTASLGFGRRITCDPYIAKETAAALNVEPVSLDELFTQSDFLSISIPLSSATRHFVNETLLRKMKPTAYLINTARGPVVDEAALLRALQQHWIAGAALDVFETEPLPPGSPLRELDNVILSPHALAWTEELARDNSLEACDNILVISRGEVPASTVNRDVLAHPAFQAKLARYRSSQ